MKRKAFPNRPPLTRNNSKPSYWAAKEHHFIGDQSKVL